MKKSQFAQILYLTNILPGRLDAASKYATDQIAGSFQFLHDVNPLLAKDLLAQLNEQLSNEKLDARNNTIRDEQKKFCDQQVANLVKDELKFSPEETVEEAPVEESKED